MQFIKHCTPANAKYTSYDVYFAFAGVQGLEPQLTVPETVVLPLDDTPIYLFSDVLPRSQLLLLSAAISTE